MYSPVSYQIGWCDDTNGWCCYSHTKAHFFQTPGQTLDEFKDECLNSGYRIFSTTLTGESYPLVWGDYVLVRQFVKQIINYLHVSTGKNFMILYCPENPSDSRYEFRPGEDREEFLYVPTEREARELLAAHIEKMKLRNLLC